MAESILKKYPHEEEEIKYEKEIVDAIKKLPIEQRFQAIALNNYILMRKQLDLEVESQIQDIVRKYNKIQAPLMDNVNQIIAGQRAVTEEELADAKTHLTSEEVEQIGQNLTTDPIPGYWHKVLTSCVKLASEISDADHEILKFITKIDHIPEDEGEDFSFVFHFAPNEYFENQQLSVKFIMIDEQEVGKIEGTDIKWKEGKDITKKTITKKQKNKKTGKTRTVNKTVDADSFFNFFKSVDGNAQEDDDEENEEDMDGQRIAISQEIAVTLQDEIVSYHLEYFLGLRTGEEDLEDELGGIDEEDEEDEDDDEEGGHGHKHGKNCAHKHKPAKGGAAGGAGGEK